MISVYHMCCMYTYGLAWLCVDLPEPHNEDGIRHAVQDDIVLNCMGRREGDQCG